MKQIAILLTDGKSNLNSNFTIPNADAAFAAGIEIFAIGMCASFFSSPASVDKRLGIFSEQCTQLLLKEALAFQANRRCGYVVLPGVSSGNV